MPTIHPRDPVVTWPLFVNQLIFIKQISTATRAAIQPVTQHRLQDAAFLAGGGDGLEAFRVFHYLPTADRQEI